MARTKNKNDRVRLQVDMNETALKSIDDLQGKLGLGSRKDVLINALTLLDWVTDEIGKGNSLMSVDQGREPCTEIVMPCFINIKQK